MTLSFFDDILIPASNLQQPSRFDEREQLYVWQFDTGDSVHDLYVDIGEPIRFKVIGEKFVDTYQSDVPALGATTSVVQSRDDLKCPYSIIGTINEPGLGLVSWWNS